MSDTRESLVLVLGEDPPARLDKALAAVVPEGVSLSRSRLGKLIEEGVVVRIADGAVVTTLKTQGVEGEAWRISMPMAVELEAVAQDIPIEIVYEDEFLIVVNKPAGMVVHPAPGSEDGTLVNALLHHCADSLSGIGGAKRPGIVHRIDKDTSGLLVVAKTDAAHQGLAKQFADHSINRRYIAFCIGVPSAADPRLRGLPGVAYEQGGVLRIATNIERHKTDRKRMAITAHSGRHAITRVQVIESFGDRAARLECWLETGRTHQIRVHMSHIGHGLIGDPVYGTRRKVKLVGFAENDAALIAGFSRQALHAALLGFVHPITEEYVAFEADLPNDLNELDCALRKLV
jgi:23S rRNA pseudouridine1911/1915/1917 synthase